MATPDVLFQAMTRPASRWGVSLEWMIVNFTLTMISFIALNSFWGFAVGAVLHPIGILIYRKDPYQLRIFGVWVQRCSASIGRKKFNASEYLA